MQHLISTTETGGWESAVVCIAQGLSRVCPSLRLQGNTSLFRVSGDGFPISCITPSSASIIPSFFFGPSIFLLDDLHDFILVSLPNVNTVGHWLKCWRQILLGVEDVKSNSVLTCTEAATVCSEGSVRERGEHRWWGLYWEVEGTEVPNLAMGKKKHQWGVIDHQWNGLWTMAVNRRDSGKEPDGEGIPVQ